MTSLKKGDCLSGYDFTSQSDDNPNGLFGGHSGEIVKGVGAKLSLPGLESQFYLLIEPMPHRIDLWSN